MKYGILLTFEEVSVLEYNFNIFAGLGERISIGIEHLKFYDIKENFVLT